MKQNQLILTIIYLFAFCAITAQDNSTRNNFVGVGVSYGLDIPGGDLADRFGNNFHAGLSLDFFNSKWNGTYGLEGVLQFGDKVNEDVLTPFRTENGLILGDDGTYADVFLRRRGAYIGAYINKTILSSKYSPHAGLNVGFGFGIWQHFIRIQDDTNSAQQLSGDYSKGYDRNTRGPALKQSLSYHHIGNNKNLNFVVGFSVMEGFTNSVRAINFDTRQSAKGSRLDLAYSLSLKWILPIKDSTPSTEIFY